MVKYHHRTQEIITLKPITAMRTPVEKNTSIIEDHMKLKKSVIKLSP
jgi:hypothetical protein